MAVKILKIVKSTSECLAVEDTRDTTLQLNNPKIKVSMVSDKSYIGIHELILILETELPPPDRDPISEPAPRDHTVKCRITRNRKGMRGKK